MASSTMGKERMVMGASSSQNRPRVTVITGQLRPDWAVVREEEVVGTTTSAGGGCGGEDSNGMEGRAGKHNEEEEEVVGTTTFAASHLSRHLTAAGTAAAASAAVRGTPGGGVGTLHVSDSRTGKKYEIPIIDGGAIKASDLNKIKAGGDGVGLKSYDPGYFNTAPVRSAISFIDGDAGILRYRGYPIEELAEKSTYLETAYLLLHGELPTKVQLTSWETSVMQHTALPEPVLAAIASLPHDAHPMGALITGLAALSALHSDANPAFQGQGVYNSKAVRAKNMVRIIGKAPTLAAAAYHLATGRLPPPPSPSPSSSSSSSNLSYAENFLYMLDSMGDTSYRPHPRLARALDIMFLLHAEHEMNCSTAACRHLASSGVDVYSAVAGATGALYGPLHGGANEAVVRMLVEIGDVNKIPEFLQGVKSKKRKMSGFGHRVYKNYDPRAKIIRNLAEEVFSIVGKDPLIEVARALEKAALSDKYFVERKLYPNVDFYSGLIYRAMGFPTAFFTVLFAIPRMAGYLAHWQESLSDPDTKIIRPQQLYTGAWLRSYAPITSRPQSKESLGVIPQSNASKRRLAGVSKL